MTRLLFFIFTLTISSVFSQSDIEKAQQQAKKEVEQFYKNSIQLADSCFSARNFVEAKNYYLNALVIKPMEQYPKARIVEIHTILDENYQSIIKEADRLFEEKEYKKAQVEYEKSLLIYPKATHAIEQITRIDKILSE